MYIKERFTATSISTEKKQFKIDTYSDYTSTILAHDNQLLILQSNYTVKLYLSQPIYAEQIMMI